MRHFVLISRRITNAKTSQTTTLNFDLSFKQYTKSCYPKAFMHMVDATYHTWSWWRLLSKSGPAHNAGKTVFEEDQKPPSHPVLAHANPGAISTRQAEVIGIMRTAIPPSDCS